MPFHFELCSPEKVILEGVVTQVALPAEEGDMVVLESHAPLNALVRTGAVHVISKDGKDRFFFVRGGALTVRSDCVRLFAETILDFETLETGRLEQKINAAEEDVHDSKTESEKKRALKVYQGLKEIHDALNQIHHHHSLKLHKQ
jgi:F-type H+-transporting ATPase subunit epsilon